ncbi:hypothetical protein BX661DRAFT_180295 [Kickxella alabastrina]|uniref:uncharacterized protein n=1 Tax=Kickxella alabastrina TaxID=61397 RepID=UPI00221E5A45|nr:uncharacterized protein BX661DRAFT_180295 [Kickxella alabastrina]KAI7830908.1 hypothetical protein BX661DRAFT_180295 [Kickxella alabastrina]
MNNLLSIISHFYCLKALVQFIFLIKIVPDTSFVVLQGLPSEAPSKNLAGRVLIRLNRPLKVKRISIYFQSVGAKKGYLRGYPDFINHRCKTIERELLWLKVAIHYSGFGFNTWTRSLPIHIFRVPEQGSARDIALTSSFRMQLDWFDAIRLDVLSDTMAIAANSKLHVQTIVRPLQKGQMLANVEIRIYEKTRVKCAVDRFGDPHEGKHIICQMMHALPLHQEHCLNLTLSIPKAFYGVQYDPEIKHELVLTATVLDDLQRPHYLKISSPVLVAPMLLWSYRLSSCQLTKILPLTAGFGKRHNSLHNPPNYHSILRAITAKSQSRS